MSNILDVAPGDLTYCPDCADVFGTLNGESKRCKCERSAHLKPWNGGDFPTPFEICWYCQAEIIRSGSRWSTYYCERCRPGIRQLNEQLDRQGKVSFPVGRHSLQHGNLKHARPFKTGAIVSAWKDRRMRQAWSAYASGGTDWVRFAAFLKKLPPDLLALADALQETEPDRLVEALRKVNDELHRRRTGRGSG